MKIRQRIVDALAKPLPEHHNDIGDMAMFDPWNDVIHGIFGCYASESDDLFIEALKAVRDATTGSLMRERGFAAELVLYVLAGHGLTEYGTSPRYAWPDPTVVDLWDQLIAKWEGWAAINESSE